MKAYLVVSGVLFGLVGIAHLLRLFVLAHNVALFLVAADSRFGRCGY
jgi:hypothetical protein